MSDTVNDVFRSGAIGAVIPPAPASAFAQSDNTGGPLNIRHIKRGHTVATLTADGDQSISDSKWTDILQTQIATSDRPVVVEASCMAYASAGTVYVSFALNGNEVTDVDNGIARAGSTVLHLSPMWVINPGPGVHTVALCARVSTSGSGTIYCADDVIVLAAREV